MPFAVETDRRCRHGLVSRESVPSNLPIGTWVWTMTVDEAGRLREVRTGDVTDLGDDAQLDGQRDPLAGVGALRGGSARFWNDNVSEVSGEPAE